MTAALHAPDQSSTIPQLFVRQANHYGPRPFLRIKQQGAYGDRSWETVADQVYQLAAYLLSDGVQPEDRIAILSENRPEWIIADLAIQLVGALSVPIYPSLTTPDVAYILRDCDARLLIVSTTAQWQKCRELADRLPTVRRVIVMDAAPLDGAGLPARDNLPRQAGKGGLWADALAAGERLWPAQQARLQDCLNAGTADQLATLIYTSGTTGEPKGVMLTHDNFLSNCRACSDALPITEADVHLSFLPLSHVFERTAGYYFMMMQGATIAYAETMETIPENMLEVRPTVMLGVPRFFEKLDARVQERLGTAPPLKRALARWALWVGRRTTPYRLAQAPLPWSLRWPAQLAEHFVFRKLRERFGGRLRFFVSGSAPLAPAIAQFFYAAGISILEGYGLTETSPVITVNRPEALRFGSVGRPVSGVDVRIAEDGEILTRGPHVMRGYFHKPQETAAAIVDGWFHTGDIGHLDADGYLVITDRKKDLIKTSGGKFVAPQKVERLLTSIPYIAQACVFGDRERFLVALLVPHFDRLGAYAAAHHLGIDQPAALASHPDIHRLIAAQIQQHQQSLASFEQIKRFAILDHEFTQATGELTPTLKAKRRLIGQRYESLIRSLYDQPAPSK